VFTYQLTDCFYHTFCLILNIKLYKKSTNHFLLIVHRKLHSRNCQKTKSHLKIPLFWKMCTFYPILFKLNIITECRSTKQTILQYTKHRKYSICVSYENTTTLVLNKIQCYVFQSYSNVQMMIRFISTIANNRSKYITRGFIINGKCSTKVKCWCYHLVNIKHTALFICV